MASGAAEESAPEEPAPAPETSGHALLASDGGVGASRRMVLEPLALALAPALSPITPHSAIGGGGGGGAGRLDLETPERALNSKTPLGSQLLKPGLPPPDNSVAAGDGQVGDGASVAGSVGAEDVLSPLESVTAREGRSSRATPTDGASDPLRTSLARNER